MCGTDSWVPAVSRSKTSRSKWFALEAGPQKGNKTVECSRICQCNCYLRKGLPFNRRADGKQVQSLLHHRIRRYCRCM